MIELEILPVHVKLMLSSKIRFFRIGSFPDQVPAWEITISATDWRCKCAPCPQKPNILTDLMFIGMQKTSLVNVKHMFFVTTVLFLLEQIL